MFSHIYSISLRVNSILLAVLFATIGSNALTLVLAVNLNHQGTSTSLIGWIMAGYSIGILLGSQFGYLIIDRSGHIRGYAASAALVTIAVFLHLFVTNPWVVFVLRLLLGASMAILYLTLESWLNATSEHHSRATIYAMYQAFYV